MLVVAVAVPAVPVAVVVVMVVVAVEVVSWDHFFAYCSCHRGLSNIQCCRVLFIAYCIFLFFVWFSDNLSCRVSFFFNLFDTPHFLTFLTQWQTVAYCSWIVWSGPVMCLWLRPSYVMLGCFNSLLVVDITILQGIPLHLPNSSMRPLWTRAHANIPDMNTCTHSG